MSTVKLHLGPGKKRIPNQEWINIDVRDEASPDLIGDVSNLSAWEDGSVDEIYACHVLEHFTLLHTSTVLREWARVLKSQEGRLWLAVPNFRAIVELYALEGVHLERLLGLLYGGQNYPANFHFTAWDFETLACQLRRCGYFNIHKHVEFPWLPRPPKYRDFSFMEISGLHCSLNVEAIAI
jgi:hypothetical protein